MTSVFDKVLHGRVNRPLIEKALSMVRTSSFGEKRRIEIVADLAGCHVRDVKMFMKNPKDYEIAAALEQAGGDAHKAGRLLGCSKTPARNFICRERAAGRLNVGLRRADVRRIYDQRDLEAALKKAGGDVTAAAAMVGCHRSTMEKCAKRVAPITTRDEVMALGPPEAMAMIADLLEPLLTGKPKPGKKTRMTVRVVAVQLDLFR